jgi:hypothetical protein
MLVSSSDGCCLEGLVGAILLRAAMFAAIDCCSSMVYGRRSTAVKVERDYEVEALGIISLVEEPESAKLELSEGSASI